MLSDTRSEIVPDYSLALYVFLVRSSSGHADWLYGGISVLWNKNLDSRGTIDEFRAMTDVC